MQERTKNLLIFLSILALYFTLSLLTAPSLIGGSDDTEGDVKQIDTNYTTDTDDTDSDEEEDIGIYKVSLPKNPDEAFDRLHSSFYVFNGTWKKDSRNQDGNFLGKFKESEGRVRVRFIYSYALENLMRNDFIPKNPTEELKVSINDGQYRDDRTLIYTLHYGVFDNKSRIYTVDDPKANITELKDLSIVETQICPLKVQIDLSSVIDANGTITDDAPISFTAISDECNIGITGKSLKRDDTDFETKLNNYSVFMIFIASVSFYQIAQIVRRVIENGADANKYSIITIGFLTIWDIYICLAHLILALEIDAVFNMLVIPIFLFFVLFGVVDMKLLVILWRLTFESRYQNFMELRRGAVVFNLKLYGSILVTLLLFNSYMVNNFFLLLSQSYLVPQIIHNVFRSQRADSSMEHLFYISAVKTLLPLYFRGCPSNFMTLRPSMWVIFAIIVWVGLQITIIRLQMKRGNKFLLPRSWFPPGYNYLMDVPERSDLETGESSLEDCAICFTSVDTQPDASSEMSPQVQDMYQLIRPRNNQCMRTPCGHKFHVHCLLNWMVIKMECPTCRTPLPSIE